LPSFIKKFLYRLKGYKIEKNVKIGIGSVIIGKNVFIGRFTKLGFFTIIRGNHIHISSHVTINSMTILDTPHIEIGEGSKINEQVFVGGMESADSKFILGKNTIIMQLTYINTMKPVIIGDDSGIGGHCLLFTHASWLNQFDGYPVHFAPITLGKSVWLPWRIFILPGSKIGDGSVIGANSLVAGEIPAKSLAVGSPAKVIRQAPDFPKPLSNEEKINLLQNILQEMMRYFQFYDIQCSHNQNEYEMRINKSWFFLNRNKLWRMRVLLKNELSENAKLIADRYNVFLSLKTISEDVRQIFTSKNCMWIDIEKKERSIYGNDLGEQVSAFLTRYGLRLTRVKE
jgi:acetyltransferase-like isoleucine patch superfamily enzyme